MIAIQIGGLAQPVREVVGRTFGRDARQVAAAGKLFTPHTWGNGIGVLANLHLVAGTVGMRAGELALGIALILGLLTNLGAVDFPTPFVSLLPVKLSGSDGAPVRIDH